MRMRTLLSLAHMRFLSKCGKSSSRLCDMADGGLANQVKDRQIIPNNIALFGTTSSFGSLFFSTPSSGVSRICESVLQVVDLREKVLVVLFS